MFLIPPPDWVMKELLHLDLASFVKQTTGTALDRKTLQRLAMGEAAPRSAERIAREYRERHPRMAEYLDAYKAQRAKELSEQGREDQRELEMTSLTWRSGIECSCAAAVDAGEPHLALKLLRDHLVPLEDASIQAEVLLRRGAYDAILEIVETCSLSRLVDVGRLREEARGCVDVQSFADVLRPVRAVACLLILAVFERQFYTRGSNPGLETVLPEQDGDTYISPIAKVIEQLERGVTASSKSAARRHLLHRDTATDYSKLRKIHRWVSTDMFPERRNFETLAIGVAAARGRTEVDKQLISILYYALRGMTSLGEMMRTSPASQHFGGYNGFFSRYHDIVAMLR